MYIYVGTDLFHKLKDIGIRFKKYKYYFRLLFAIDTICKSYLEH